MTPLNRRWLFVFVAAAGVGVLADRASAAVFTVNIFDLNNQPRKGVNVTVAVAAVDANNNVVANPNVNFDGDKVGGVLAISTQKDVIAGSTVITVNDPRVSAVEFTFSGNGLDTTFVQRLRNVKNLEYDVAVPDEASPPACVQCLASWEESQHAKFRRVRRLFRR